MTDEGLIRALCDDSVSTAEAVGSMGADAKLLAIPKPSRDDETWLVEFKAAADGPPMAVRMRAMLKAALRQYRLRAVLIRNPTAAELVTARTNLQSRNAGPRSPPRSRRAEPGRTRGRIQGRAK